MLTLRAIVPCSRALAHLSRNALRNTTLTKAVPLPAIATATFIPAQKHRWYASKVQSSKDESTGQERIYYGTLAPRMKAVKFFSLTTSLAGLAAQPILLEQGMKMGGTGMAVFLCGFAGIFTFVTPLLLHFITKKYVTEIHYDAANNEYTATTISIILHKIETKFRPEDVKVPEVSGMFTSFMVGKKPLFVDPSLFEDPEHYVRIMGYDKPIDFKLDLKESTDATTSKAAQKADATK